MDILRTIFTGAGLAYPGGGRVSYQWLGIGQYILNQPPVYESLVNGSIQFKESATATSLPTTAWNGFTDGYVGNSTVSGSVQGWVKASDTAPTSNGVRQSMTSQLYWMKILIGSLYYECVAAITDLDFKSAPSEDVEVTFNFTFIGQPVAAQFTPFTGGSAPL